jgi:hypothetical protein
LYEGRRQARAVKLDNKLYVKLIKLHAVSRAATASCIFTTAKSNNFSKFQQKLCKNIVVAFRKF